MTTDEPRAPIPERSTADTAQPDRPPTNPASRLLDTVVREEWGQILAALIATFRDFELAEDAL